ncbi:hypothetical protein AB2B38_009715 [Balneola sp. MJW-20]|uniref:hypothetical protein n=1 Tax=Gracilimonas aurantiaca TaxID=3234185 RepID=UPI003467A63D
MKKETTIQHIDLYLRDKLSEEEIRKLWVELMKDPELMQRMETEAALHHLFNNEQGDKVQEPDQLYNNKKKWFPFLIVTLLHQLSTLF